VLADDGCQLWTHRSGVGPPLLLCHGGPGLWDRFAPVQAMLHRDATVIRWDQRGCGRSQRQGPYTFDRFIADADTVRQHLAGADTALLGHSWGATLALFYALRHPDRASRLIYVSGIGIDPIETWMPAYQDRFQARLGPHFTRWDELRGRTGDADAERERAVLQWSTDFSDPAAALSHARDMATPWFEINRECNEALHIELRQHLGRTDLVERCRALDRPVLIIDGADDLRPRSAIDSLYDALPNATRVTLPGVGHLPWVEAPAAFESAVKEFLSAGT
jgi:proline iminopeptidase